MSIAAQEIGNSCMEMGGEFRDPFHCQLAIVIFQLLYGVVVRAHFRSQFGAAQAAALTKQAQFLSEIWCGLRHSRIMQQVTQTGY